MDPLADDDALRARVIRNGRVSAFDAQRRHRDGRPLDVSVTAGVILDERGAIIGMAKVIRGVAERTAHERRLTEFGASLEQRVAERTTELEAARRDLRTVLDAVRSMIGYWDRDLVNRFANHAYAGWLRVASSALPGQTMRALIGAEPFRGQPTARRGHAARRAAALRAHRVQHQWHVAPLARAVRCVRGREFVLVARGRRTADTAVHGL